MRGADAYVRARIDTDTKERAIAALKAMGLSISDAIRLLMVHVADEGCLPFGIKMKRVRKRNRKHGRASSSTAQAAARDS